MSIFSHYQSRYEDSKDEEFSLNEYFSICQKEPSSYVAAEERMLSAIGDSEQLDSRKTLSRFRIFGNRVADNYPAFKPNGCYPLFFLGVDGGKSPPAEKHPSLLHHQSGVDNPELVPDIPKSYLSNIMFARSEKRIYDYVVGMTSTEVVRSCLAAMEYNRGGLVKPNNGKCSKPAVPGKYQKHSRKRTKKYSRLKDDKPDTIFRDLDKSLRFLKQNTRELKALEDRLVQQGCTEGYSYFRGNKMYIRGPLECNGKRKSQYIGVDLVKQQNALDRIDRFRKLKQIRTAIDHNECKYLEFYNTLYLLKDQVLDSVHLVVDELNEFSRTSCERLGDE